MAIALFVLQTAATWFMTGLIWFVQVVHYPLYTRIGEAEFAVYERDHCSLTTLVVAPVMLVELFSAILLCVNRPKFVGMPECIVNVILLGVIWLSTMFIADQLHGSLGSGLNIPVVKALVAWNWLRTVCWTVRGLGLSYVLIKGLSLG